MKPHPRPLQLAGLPAIEQIRKIRHGLPVQSLDQLARIFELSRSKMVLTLGLKPAQVAREIRTRQRLSPATSERVLRGAIVLVSAGQIFIDTEASVRWLRTPLKALGGTRPIDLLDTEPGAQMVSRFLTGLAHGNVM